MSTEDFIGSFIKIPSSMIEDEDSLLIDTGKDDHVEFLTLYKESRDNLISKRFVKATVKIEENYKDVRNIVNLMNDLNITNIFELKISSYEYSSYDEDEKYLISLSSGEKCETEIRINDGTPYFKCEQGKVTLEHPPSLLKEIPEDLLQKSTSFNVTIWLIANDVNIDGMRLFIQRLLSYNTPITLSNIAIKSPYVKTINDMIKELNIKNIGSLTVWIPSYNDDEKHLISLVSGEEYKTEIMIDDKDDFCQPHFKCKQGQLTLECPRSLLKEIPEDLLQK
eukprot:TCONS_00056199-protein